MIPAKLEALSLSPFLSPSHTLSCKDTQKEQGMIYTIASHPPTLSRHQEGKWRESHRVRRERTPVTPHWPWDQRRASWPFLFFSFFFFNVYLFFETEREHERGRVREREGDTESEAGSRLRAASPEPDAGLEPADREVTP